MDTSFEHITSTEHALNLLQQFQAILQRDTLRQDLEGKYLVIFQNYAKDLEQVQKLYEQNKMEPPTPRNAPPVAGELGCCVVEPWTAVRCSGAGQLSEMFGRSI